MDRDRPAGNRNAARQPLRVLLMPDATALNPYQRRLADALAGEGVEVALAQPAGVLPLLGALRRHPDAQVLHLHWTHRLVLGGSRWRSALKGLRFLLELALLRRRVRVVWTAHNLLEHERRFPRLELAVHRCAARLYHAIIVHCEAAERALAASYRLRGGRGAPRAVIPHGHYIGVHSTAAERRPARRALGLEETASVFAHLGQIRPYKGVFELIDAFARLRAPRAYLLVAGRPWDAATAARLAAHARRDPRVRVFPGFIPEARMPLYLGAADALVLPYRDVLTSGSAMLAMSYGRAVIMPRCGCAAEMLGEAGTLLYDPAAPGALDAALRRALATDLEALGAAGRSRAEAFDWAGIAARTAAVYRGPAR